MNSIQNKISTDIFTKKVLLLNKLYYIITHQIWTYRNMDDLDNLIDRFTELSDSIQKPQKEEMLLKNIRNSGLYDTIEKRNKGKHQI